ncbi:MAG: SDR family oxidoreductase [Actinomycetota bacterium]
MSVLIVGCGDIGTETGLRLARKGNHVIGWRRSPSKLPSQIEGVSADLAGDLPRIPHTVHTVIFAAAADAHTRSAYQSTYVMGLSNALGALRRDGVNPRRFLFVSSTAVCGGADGAVVDESTPTLPGSFSGQVMLEAESLVISTFADTPTSVTSLRLGGIYGPGRTRLIDRVRSGLAVIPDHPRYTNRIHRDDAAAAIVHLTTMAMEPDALYLGVDEEPAELGEVLRFLANELGLAEPPVGHVDLARGGDKRCSSLALQMTGFRFTYPSYREGYRAVLAGVGKRHP